MVQPAYIASELVTSIPSLFQEEDSLSILAFGVSLFTMAAISVDRLLALHYHMRYPDLMTQRCAISTSATVWLICTISSCLSFWSKEIHFLIIALGVAICLLVSIFSYISIYFIVRRCSGWVPCLAFRAL